VDLWIRRVALKWAFGSAAPAESNRSKLNGSDTGWYEPAQLKVTPPIPVARDSPGGIGEVTTTVPVVVSDDAVAEHDVPEQGWDVLKIVKKAEVAAVPDVIPGLVPLRVYPMPGWLIDRSENEAMPPLADTMTVPDSFPEPGFDPMATVTAALEAVASWPDPSRTSTLTGPPWDMIVEPATVLVGWPSLVNASEHDPVTEPERLLEFAESSWKLLPGGPLKSFDCLPWIAPIPHW
jgi:hypothetical protein